VSTVSLTYDLARDEEAQAFRVAVASESLFAALIDFYLLALRRRDRRARPQRAHVVRALLRDRVTQRRAAWAFKANALKPRGWRRPARVVTLTVEVGFPYRALINADAIFAAARDIDDSFRPDDSLLSWKEMVATILAKLEARGASGAFFSEIESREVKVRL
jgi:hypothetical protein